MEKAITDLMNDEAWVAKSGRQARSTVALFELLIGKKPFAAIVEGDLSTFKRKIRHLPTRYSMSDAGNVLDFDHSWSKPDAWFPSWWGDE